MDIRPYFDSRTDAADARSPTGITTWSIASCPTRPVSAARRQLVRHAGVIEDRRDALEGNGADPDDLEHGARAINNRRRWAAMGAPTVEHEVDVVAKLLDDLRGVPRLRQTGDVRGRRR